MILRFKNASVKSTQAPILIVPRLVQTQYVLSFKDVRVSKDRIHNVCVLHTHTRCVFCPLCLLITDKYILCKSIRIFTILLLIVLVRYSKLRTALKALF